MSVYERFQPVVRRIVGMFCRRTPLIEADDLCQDVWNEIIAKLPGLRYRSDRGGLSSWMATLAWRRACCSARRAMVFPAWHPGDVGELEIPSSDLGPQESCLLIEMQHQLNAALVSLRQRTLPRSYEVFYQRVFGGQTIKEIAEELRLTPENVRQRLCRALKKWRTVAGDWPALDSGFIGFAPPVHVPPITMVHEARSPVENAESLNGTVF